MGSNERSLPERIEQGDAEAKRRIRVADEYRRDFVRRYFRNDIDDREYFDLVINSEFIGVGRSVGIIKSAIAGEEPA